MIRRALATPAALIGSVLLLLAAAPLTGQSLNVDFGDSAHKPSDTYAAAGLAGSWNSIPGFHGTTTTGLVDVTGAVTGISLVQIGGLQTLTVVDPDTTGDDAWLMDDYLVTFNAGLESCIFLSGVEPGRYEVLIYARMPAEPGVLSDTFVDQEPGIPHYAVGGPWPGGHQLLLTYSRHEAIVGTNGKLDFHSGIVPGDDPLDGAALNGFQIRRIDVFDDGFESGDTSAWSTAVGD